MSTMKLTHLTPNEWRTAMRKSKVPDNPIAHKTIFM